MTIFMLFLASFIPFVISNITTPTLFNVSLVIHEIQNSCIFHSPFVLLSLSSFSFQPKVMIKRLKKF
uniref:Uncharacterized protein n=1 Tax=Rhizophora mucronata TaxID=61149 RepID=A0A2P2PWM4_RHIMU